MSSIFGKTFEQYPLPWRVELKLLSDKYPYSNILDANGKKVTTFLLGEDALAVLLVKAANLHGPLTPDVIPFPTTEGGGVA